MSLFAISVICSLKFKGGLRRNKSNENQCHRYGTLLKQQLRQNSLEGQEPFFFSSLLTNVRGEKNIGKDWKSFSFSLLGQGLTHNLLWLYHLKVGWAWIYTLTMKTFFPPYRAMNEYLWKSCCRLGEHTSVLSITRALCRTTPQEKRAESSSLCWAFHISPSPSPGWARKEIA